MHEFSIAQALMDQILAVSDQNRLKNVTRVEVETGALREIIEEIMQTAFSASSAGTVAEGAQLVLTEKPALACCRQCSHQFIPQINDYICPSCGKADVEVVEGNKIVLLAVHGEQEDNKA